MEAPIAKAAAMRRQLAKTRSYRFIRRSDTAIANRGSIRRKRRTRPPLAHQKRETKVLDSRTPGSGRHHFF
jgi:hypothetical protein